MSNSILQARWRSLRHQWLYLNTLDTAAAVRRLVAFYVTEHNEILPHSALNGRTPDEVYFARAENVPAKLAAARQAAGKERLAANRTLSCEACVAPGPAASHQATAARSEKRSPEPARKPGCRTTEPRNAGGRDREHR
jgi:hypothetical protein